jgi:ABC-type lipoprotein export system ATPase subunit
MTLALRNVWRTYQVGDAEVVALRDVSLCLPDGAFIAIVGPSGSGKSTLLQLVGLLDRPSRGSIELDGCELGELSDAERTRLRLRTFGFVFQRFHLLSELTAIENVALPLEAAGVPPRERYERAAMLLEDVGLGPRLFFRPAQLSGGQRQRVAIARALANRPRLILADEPTGELHSDDKAVVIGLLRRFQREGRTVVVVTHDADVAAVADQRIEIRDGQVKPAGFGTGSGERRAAFNLNLLPGSAPNTGSAT